MDFCKRYDAENYDYQEDRYFEETKFEDKNNNHDGKKTCCVKRVETYYCYPSYYTEEKKDDCKNENKRDECKEEKKEVKRPTFYEGTFKLYPSYCEDKDDHKHDIKHEEDKKDKCNKKEDDRHENNKCCSRRCCFCCNLFGNCGRRW